MFGLETVVAMGQSAGTFFQEDDVKSLLRLNRLPVKEIEKRAQAHGLWHPKTGKTAPAPGDLVTFSVGKDTNSPHIACILKVNNDGSLRVRSESALRAGKGSEEAQNAVDEEFTLKASEVRGTISTARPGSGSLLGEMLSSIKDDLFPLGTLLKIHENFKNIVCSVIKKTI